MRLTRGYRAGAYPAGFSCVSVVLASISGDCLAGEETNPGAVFSPTTTAATNLLTPTGLERANVRIGDIKIINENIFNPGDPNENRTIHRWANAVHIVTRPNVINTQLLFEPGDLYKKQQIEETERLLRSNRYLRDAKVSVIDFEDGVVDLEVRTTDVWTLNPSVSFGRGGGENHGGIGLKEFNLFGAGASVGISYKTDVDRDSLSLKYFDRNVLSSRYALRAEYSDASDGFSQRLSIERPFYALGTKRAGGARLQSGRRTESLYDIGEIAAQFEHKFVSEEVYLGWSDGLSNGWSKRYVAGIGYDSHEYAILDDGLYPQASTANDRRFIYPFVGMELLQDDYITTRNFDQLNRTEDRHLGMRASAKLGYASPALGSSERALLFSGDASSTPYRSKKSTLAVGAALAGRLEGDSPKNVQFSVSGRYDRRQSENKLLHVSLAASLGTNLDLENTAYLGGDTGLRGYPLRYQAGDSSVLFTIEQRLFTDWYPFHLFNVGGAVFFDAGRTWGADPVSGKNYGWLRDVGVGLRIGSTRSGVGRVLHIDLAYPLDGGADISHVQFLIETRNRF